MELRPIKTFESPLLPLLDAKIDTEQITPARFLGARAPGGYGKILFYDRRFTEGGEPRPGCALNRPELAGASILLTGESFGCGASPDIAAAALVEYGIRAVISTSFGAGFRDRALERALLPIAVSERDHRDLAELVEIEPRAPVRVDLRAQTLFLAWGEKICFPFDASAKEGLLRGPERETRV